MAENIIFLIGMLIAVVLLAYGVVIIILTAGWRRLVKKSTQNSDKSATPPAISVVIAARNEEKNIVACLQSISNQTYKYPVEVIVVDDHSTDGTKEIVSGFIRCNTNRALSITLLGNSENSTGKKAALHQAILIAAGDWIVTTDADCIAQPGWLETISGSIRGSSRQLYSAPVLLEPALGMFQKFQQLEFISLVACGAGAIEKGNPIMCNGANLIFKKQAVYGLLHSGLIQQWSRWVSGDDVFLMTAIKKRYGGNSIGFIAQNSATIYTLPQSTVDGFLRQRIRWASKTLGYSNWFTFLVATMVFSTSFLLLSGTLLSLFFSPLLPYVVGGWAIKLLTDFPLLYLVTRFFAKTKLLWYYPLFQMVYVFYISIVAPASQIINISWKGRKWKR